MTAGVFGALVELLNAVADEGPLTIIMDDVHRAEASSWSILGPLFPLVSTNLITWLIALSAESQQAATHRFRTIFPPDEATSDKSRDMHWLAPLPDAAIRELCVARAAPREIPERSLSLMVKQAVGVPFFAEALIEQWFATGDASRVPPSVARLTHSLISSIGFGVVVAHTRGCSSGGASSKSGRSSMSSSSSKSHVAGSSPSSRNASIRFDHALFPSRSTSRFHFAGSSPHAVCP